MRARLLHLLGGGNEAHNQPSFGEKVRNLRWNERELSKL
jgi:hypothetical protein